MEVQGITRTKGHGFDGLPSRVPPDRIPALFFLEPEMSLAAGVVASWRPVATLRAPRAAERVDNALVRDTVTLAIEKLGARIVVVCAEADIPPGGRAAEQLVRRCRTVSEAFAPVLRAHGAAVEALWVDRAGVDLYRWDAVAEQFFRLTDVGLERWSGVSVRRHVS